MSKHQSLHFGSDLVALLTQGRKLLGLVLAGVGASYIVPGYGWRGALAFGGVVPLVIFPLIAIWMPESVRFLASCSDGLAALRVIMRKITGRDEWDEVTFVVDYSVENFRSPMTHLFATGYSRKTFLSWISCFGSLFALYLMTKWLPTILKDEGYTIVQAAQISAMLPVGGIWFYPPRATDGPYAPVKVLVVSYAGTALCFVLIGYVMSNAEWLATAIFLAGFGAIGGQNGLNLIAAAIYPTASGATGVAWSPLAVGRAGAIAGSMTGGWLMLMAGDPRDLFVRLSIPIVTCTIALISMLSSTTPQDERKNGAMNMNL
ncbi:MFS transporter [Burkholderia sp. BCC1985]|uniref:MFS transporter n=2 Tax=unclassified Burkholderia TaxID=2613784 RepID=UPI002AB10848|nr:MFS transporter [Burkholderia sp. BCC1985]